MKEEAYILKYKGKELRTPADVSAVQEALFNDLAAGKRDSRGGTQNSKRDQAYTEEIQVHAKDARSGSKIP